MSSSILDNGEHAGRTYAGPAINRKWAEGELEAFLEIISAHNLQASLLRKRNGKAFYLLSREMAKRDFSQLPDQLRLKYHQLRRQYAKARKSGESLAHLDELQTLFDDNNRGGGQEVDSAHSLDSGEEEFDAPMSSESESESMHQSLAWQRFPFNSFPLLFHSRRFGCFNALQCALQVGRGWGGCVSWANHQHGIAIGAAAQA